MLRSNNRLKKLAEAAGLDNKMLQQDATKVSETPAAWEKRDRTQACACGRRPGTPVWSIVPNNLSPSPPFGPSVAKQQSRHRSDTPQVCMVTLDVHVPSSSPIKEYKTMASLCHFSGSVANVRVCFWNLFLCNCIRVVLINSLSLPPPFLWTKRNRPPDARVRARCLFKTLHLSSSLSILRLMSGVHLHVCKYV